MKNISINSKIIASAFAIIAIIASGVYVFKKTQNDRTVAQEEVQSAEGIPEVAPPVEPEPVVVKPEPLKAVELSKKSFVFELNSEKSFPTLTWEAVVGAEGYVVEVSNSPQFNKNVYTESVVQPTWTWNRPGLGQYYVRIKAERQLNQEKESVMSAATPIRILLSPPSLMSLDLNQDKPSFVSAQGEGHALSSKYEIQVADNQEFSEAKTFTSQKINYAFEVPVPQIYYVRARSLNSKGWPVSRYSNTLEVLVPEWKMPLAEEVIEVKPNEAVAEAVAAREETLDDRYLLDSKGEVSIGSGMGHLNFKQIGDDGATSGSFSKSAWPTVSLGAEFQLSQKSRLSLEYTSQVGHVDPGVNTINQDKYEWKSLVAEYQTVMSESKYEKYSLLLGVQQQEVPLLSTDVNDDADIVQNQMLNASIGVQAKFLSENKDYEYELYARYQHMLSSQSLDGYQFKAHPTFMLDGGVGVSKYFGNGFKAGLHWLGQQQKFTYEFMRDGSASTGNQSFFNSQIQFKFGYEFYSFLGVATIPLFYGLRRGRNRKKAEKRNEQIK